MVAGNLLEAESSAKVDEREKFLAEKCPPLDLPYSRDELLVRHKEDRPTAHRVPLGTRGTGGPRCRRDTKVRVNCSSVV